MDAEHESVILLAMLYLRWKKRKRSNRKMWIHPIVEARREKGQFYHLFGEIRKDEAKFFNYIRMSIASFDELLHVIQEKITKNIKKNTHMRSSIPPEEKLVITLGYLATGCSLTDIHYNFRVGRSTAGAIIKEVCEAIWFCLLEATIPQLTTEKFLEIAEGFEKYTNFSNCIGAIDGKHVRTKQPPNSGSMNYNYKNYFSTVLFAMCDANYCFTYVDIGAYGKSSDAGIFRNSTLFDKLCIGSLGIPPPRSIENSSDKYPFVIVGDEAFPLLENLLRPYGGKHLTDIRKAFNYRLSVARRYIECTFGILTNKWRIFHRPMDVDIDFVETIIKASCVLHNFVRIRDGMTEEALFVDDMPQSRVQNLTCDPRARGNSRALAVRDKFAQYFAKTHLGQD